MGLRGKEAGKEGGSARVRDAGYSEDRDARVCSPPFCLVTVQLGRGPWGALSIARLMGPCRNFPVAPRGLRADSTRPRPPDGPALHEFQLCGCLEHSRDIPHFWTEQRTQRVIVLLRTRFKVLRFPGENHFQMFPRLRAQSAHPAELAVGV